MSTYGSSGSSAVGQPGSEFGPTGSDSASSGTKEVAKEQAGQVGQSAAQAGGEVAQQTKEQAKNVVGEATQQARDLAGELRTQVGSQAGSQLERLVGAVRGLADELREMSASGQSGVASEVARQASGRAQSFADYLEEREPADLLDDVRGFARRRSGAFLVGAGLAGVVAGRLVKGVTAAGSDGPSQSRPSSPAYAGQSTYPPQLGTTYPPSGLTDYDSPSSAGVYGSPEPPSAPHGDPLAGTGPGTYGDPTSGTRPYESPGSTPGSVTP